MLQLKFRIVLFNMSKVIIGGWKIKIWKIIISTKNMENH